MRYCIGVLGAMCLISLSITYLNVFQFHDEIITDAILEAIPNNLTLAVSTLVMNQGVYLLEWIEFHRLMGFQFFIIFDHNSTDNTTAILKPYISCGIVLLVDASRNFPRVCKTFKDIGETHHQAPCQKLVFNYALGLLKGKAKWIGNFDVDEFFWTPERALPLAQLLQSPNFESVQKVNVVGIVYGTNNIEFPKYDKPVIGTYTKRPDGITPGKSDHGSRFAHKALYRPEQTLWVSVHDTTCVFMVCYNTKNYEPFSSELRFNHYQWKSRHEQHMKSLLNGNPIIDYNPASEAYWNAIEDTGITYLLPMLLEGLENLTSCLK